MSVTTFRHEARLFLEQAAPRFAHAPRARGGLFSAEVDGAAEVEDARGWQQHLAENGWAAPGWPTEFGGRGASPEEAAAWAEELSRFPFPSTAVFTIGLGMAGPTIISMGDRHQQARYLDRILRADDIWCQLFSEPDAGSDLAAVRTKAVRAGDHYLVTGQKIWTSGAHYSDLAIMLARTDPSVPKHRGLGFFIVDMHSPGIEVRPLKQMSGATNFNMVFLDQVEVPLENRIAGETDGWKVAMGTLAHERAVVSSPASATLSGGGDLDGLLPHVRMAPPELKERFVRSWVAHRVVQWTAADNLNRRAAGEDISTRAAMSKLLQSAAATDLADLALDLLGAEALTEGVTEDGDSWRAAFLGAPAMHIAGGTDEVLLTQIGERMLGLPPDTRVDKDVPFASLGGLR